LRSHVVRGRPRGLFQSSNGWSKMTLLASIVSLILATCPNKAGRCLRNIVCISNDDDDDIIMLLLSSVTAVVEVLFNVTVVFMLRR